MGYLLVMFGVAFAFLLMVAIASPLCREWISDFFRKPDEVPKWMSDTGMSPEQFLRQCVVDQDGADLSRELEQIREMWHEISLETTLELHDAGLGVDEDMHLRKTLDKLGDRVMQKYGCSQDVAVRAIMEAINQQ